MDFFFEGQEIGPTLIRRIFSPFSAMEVRGLNYSAILPSKNIGFTPAIVTTGRDFNTIRPAYGLL